MIRLLFIEGKKYARELINKIKYNLNSAAICNISYFDYLLFFLPGCIFSTFDQSDLNLKVIYNLKQGKRDCFYMLAISSTGRVKKG